MSRPIGRFIKRKYGRADRVEFKDYYNNEFTIKSNILSDLLFIRGDEFHLTLTKSQAKQFLSRIKIWIDSGNLEKKNEK